VPNGLTIQVSTVYSLSMPKYVYVQLGAAGSAHIPAPLRIRADKLERDERTNRVVLKLGNESVGEISGAVVLGWWVQDEDEA